MFYDRVLVSVSASGDTLVPGSAVAGYRGFSVVSEGDRVGYVIEDGKAWETGHGVWDGSSLTRELSESSTGSVLSLTSRARLAITALAEDLEALGGGGDAVLSVNGQTGPDVTLGPDEVGAVPAGSLATVAETGAYGDLSGTPSLASVATSGAYSDLSGKPTLGDAAAKNTGTSAGTVAAGDDSRITGAAQKGAANTFTEDQTHDSAHLIMKAGSKLITHNGTDDGSGAGRIVTDLVSVGPLGAATTGAVVFIAPVAMTSAMLKLDVEGFTFSETNQAVDFTVHGYKGGAGAWELASVAHRSTHRPMVRWGVTSGGAQCLIVGDVTTVWPYSTLAVTKALISYSGADEGAEEAYGWTSNVVTSLSGFTQVTSDLTAAQDRSNAQALDGKPASAYLSYLSSRPRVHAFGGQLRNLVRSLTNPLEQITNLTLMGDSKTWGLTLSQNRDPNTPARNGTPADVRDDFTAPSWANDLKRWIGETYFDSATPTHSNWSYSAGGQSTTEYSKTLKLYPNQAPFTITTSGSSVSTSETQDAACVLGYMLLLADGNTAGTSYLQIAFTFTGDSFTLIYTSNTGDNMDYELYVDGVLQGTYATAGGASTYGNRRTHSFTYVRNKTIQIRSKRASPTGNQRLRLEAIEVAKKCRIVNQGIIGTTPQAYLVYCFGAYGPSILTSDVNHVLMKFGTNARLKTAAAGVPRPNGPLTFRKELKDLIAAVTPSAGVTLIADIPASDENPSTMSFNMATVRDVNIQLGSELSLDVIDNYAAFKGASLSDVLADGLHANALGHAIELRNIVGALEAA